MRYFLFILAMFISAVAFSQRYYKPVFNLDDPGWKNSGWHFSPGMTYMFPSKMKNTRNTENADIKEELRASGRFSFYAEVGRHHLIKGLYFLDHLDYGISYKRLSGKEKTEIICQTCDAQDSEGIFKDNFAGVYVNFSNISQLSKYSFIQNGFGINGDYRFLLNQTRTPENPDVTFANPEPLQVQLHYKFSFGTMAEKGLFILPSIEIPLLNVAPFAEGRSTLIYFDSGYRPIIFSLKFMFLSKRKPADCKGSSDGKSGHKLWGRDMR